VPVLGPAPAGAAAVACGTTVTTSVTLHADLACTGPGLIVDADHVTVDLNRHRIAGAGAGEGISSAGHHGVTIRNGPIEGFATGVRFSSQADSRILRVTVTGNQAGIFSLLGTGIVVGGSRVAANGLGIGAGGGAGMVIEKSTVTANEAGLVFAGSSNANTVRENVISSNQTGVTFSESDRSTLGGNRIVENGTGVSVYLGGGHTFTANTITGSAGAGVLITGVGSPGNALVRNTVSGNRVGVQVGDASGLVVAPGTTIRDNEFRSNGAAGLLLLATLGTVDGTVVGGNTFSGNGASPGGTVDTTGAIVDDGFHADVSADAGTVNVTSNTAVANADLGIEAATVTDGGGNAGRRNGDAQQCTGVACRR
jgi:nitrous oxidase accessory protein NosD